MQDLMPYLMFNGDCAAAFDHYKECFGGEIEFMGKYGDSPMEVPDDQKDKVMHTTIRFWGGAIMGSDYVKEADYTTEGSSANVHLSLSFKDAETMDATFEKLGAGGTVTMPLGDQFWGDRFGMLTDRFGIQWMFSCPAKKE